MNIVAKTRILIAILFGIILSGGCASTRRGNDVENIKIEGEPLISSNEYVLTSAELERLQKMSKRGDCEASLRLYEYYTFQSPYRYLGMHYAQLSYEQGCEHAKEDVDRFEYALGIKVRTTE